MREDLTEMELVRAERTSTRLIVSELAAIHRTLRTRQSILAFPTSGLIRAVEMTERNSRARRENPPRPRGSYGSESCTRVKLHRCGRITWPACSSGPDEAV